MRHLKQGRRLSRTASHRKALLAALSIALIKNKRIQTTTAKAKETRRIIEPLITRARDAYMREKSGEPVDVHARREVAKFIRDKEALKILFSDIAEKVGKRPGGYTRVLKLGNRLGDGAEMSVIELVDYNEAQDDKKRRDRVARSKAATARRKASDDRKDADKKAAPAKKEAAPAEEPAAEEPVADQPLAEAAVDTPSAEAAPAADDAPVADDAPAAEGEDADDAKS